jgi:tripartite-type tricarboxylate transporter receptor subunit TctC
VSTHATNPALQLEVQYDGIKDFEPIALLARTPVVLFTAPVLAGEGREVTDRARQGEDRTR